jgi:hypothetical protein
MLVSNSIMFQTQIHCCKVFHNYTESENILPCILLNIHHIKTYEIKNVDLSELYIVWHAIICLYDEPFSRKLC